MKTRIQKIKLRVGVNFTVAREAQPRIILDRKNHWKTSIDDNGMI